MANETMHIYFPLKIATYPKGEYGVEDSPTEITSAEAVAYEDAILAAIAKENRFFENDRGLAEYIHDDALNEKVYSLSMQISLGVDCDLSDEPHDVFIKLEKPVCIAGVEKRGIWIKNYCFDRTLCPEGKSVVTTIITTDYEYWNNLSQNKGHYRIEKENIARTFIEVFEGRFPKAAGKVEVYDVATPMTYSRYTGAWRGAYMGCMSIPQWPIMSVPSTLPGLEAFYMTGQWTNPRGGLPIALTTARGTLMRICEADGRKFETV